MIAREWITKVGFGDFGMMKVNTIYSSEQNGKNEANGMVFADMDRRGSVQALTMSRTGI